MASDRYYITTPIYYVNDRPHIGHCYTTVVADVAARFQRLLRGEGRRGLGGVGSVYFLTGTDEHADKVVTSAAQHGVTPQEWADRNAAEFRRAFEFMGVAFDDFIRTTEPRHRDKVPGYIERLLRSGDIYKGSYTGWYDEGQEEYLTETAAKEANYHSPINKKPLVKRTEPCYFFKLSAYQDRLRTLIESGELKISPDSRRSEVLGRLRPPAVLNDVPVSRPVTSDPATQWGVRMPGDPENRVYVWIDALFNYHTAVAAPGLENFWPASVHLIGKDILWFHSVIWPALLLALGEPLPREIFGHGWWVSEGQKMSKSLGNFIDLEKLESYVNRFSLDALRWFLATQGPLSGADADFSHAKFVEVYNSDLANGIGNSTSRVSNMIAKYFGGQVPEAKLAPEFRPALEGLTQRARAAAGKLDLPEALGIAVGVVSKVDLYINQTEPFRLAKGIDTDPAVRPRLAEILYTCAEALRIASLFMWPAMPAKMEDLWRRWGCAHQRDGGSWAAPLDQLAEPGGPFSLKAGQSIQKGDPLFMRADPALGAP